MLFERTSIIRHRRGSSAVGSPLADAQGFGALASELPALKHLAFFPSSRSR